MKTDDKTASKILDMILARHGLSCEIGWNALDLSLQEKVHVPYVKSPSGSWMFLYAVDKRMCVPETVHASRALQKSSEILDLLLKTCKTHDVTCGSLDDVIMKQGTTLEELCVELDMHECLRDWAGEDEKTSGERR